jgi:amino acid permease
LPYLACIPAIVALLAALSHVLGYFSHWRPKWTVPFVSELRDTRELPLDAPKQPLRWTIALLICSVIGLLAETVQFVPPDIDMSVFVLAFSWVSNMLFLWISATNPRSGYCIDSDRNQATEIMFDINAYVLHLCICD